MARRLVPAAAIALIVMFAIGCAPKPGPAGPSSAPRTVPATGPSSIPSSAPSTAPATEPGKPRVLLFTLPG